MQARRNESDLQIGIPSQHPALALAWHKTLQVNTEWLNRLLPVLIE